MKKGILVLGLIILVVGGVTAITPFFMRQPNPLYLPLAFGTDSKVLVHEDSRIIPAGFFFVVTTNLNAGDMIHYNFECQSYDINFYILDAENYGKFISAQPFTPEVAREHYLMCDASWRVPNTGTYYFVFDNSFSLITPKTIDADITNSWITIDTLWLLMYLSVQELPPMASYLFITGIGLAIIGTAVTIYGGIKEEYE